MRRSIGAVTACSVLAFAACDPEQPLPDVHFARDCDGRGLTACDILEESCRAQYFEYVACLKDRPPGATVPAVMVLTEAELADQLRSESSPEQFEGERALYRALALLDLMPAEVDPGGELIDSEAASIAAYYDPETKDLVIIDHGRPLDDLNTAVTFSHESVHAFQDIDFDLAHLFDEYVTDADRDVGVRSLIEGEAVFYMNLVAYALLERSYWEGEPFGPSQRDAMLRFVQRTETPYVSGTTFFPYTFGLAYIEDMWRREGAAGIESLFADPPVTSAQIFGGDTRVPRAHEIPHLGDDLHLAAGLSSYELVAHTVLGRWGIAMLAARHRSVARWEEEQLGDGWRTDDFYAYRDPATDKHAFVWTFAWEDDPSRARGEELAAFAKEAAMNASLPWRVVADDDDAVLVGSEDPSLLDAWAATATAALNAVKVL